MLSLCSGPASLDCLLKILGRSLHCVHFHCSSGSNVFGKGSLNGSNVLRKIGILRVTTSNIRRMIVRWGAGLLGRWISGHFQVEHSRFTDLHQIKVNDETSRHRVSCLRGTEVWIESRHRKIGHQEWKRGTWIGLLWEDQIGNRWKVGKRHQHNSVRCSSLGC